MHDNAYTDFCQNCVLGLQWNIKSKVENSNKQTNKQEMIDKLKT